MEKLVSDLKKLIDKRKQDCLDLIEKKYQCKEDGDALQAEWLDGRIAGVGCTLCDLIDIINESGEKQ